ncbi:hypothetical protein FCIRC_12207 [Fusarium circinatum]|uniref:Uncharacterized protein n=1 Tax=Fusarium circinatum TaxID=48490 RepID=A0A8H5WJG5_FUSCI|nr:hypothetical protein FCIRC_12207 [Fusarium circinatum]
MRTNFDPVDKHTKDKSISAYERITTVFFRSHHFVPLKSISQRWLKDITVCTGCYDSFDDLWSCTQASAPAVHLYLAKFGASYMYSRGSVAQKQARDKPASIIAWTNDRFHTAIQFRDPDTSCSNTLLDQGPQIPDENEYSGNSFLAPARGAIAGRRTSRRSSRSTSPWHSQR